ncbi:MAG TPA: endonuclease/exonuclease/phosphatase family protein, partial [Gemmatimonadaceae bacterium]
MKALLSAIVCLSAMAQPAVAQSFLNKRSGAVRVMTWNIGANSIFPEAPGPDTASVGRPARFRRVIRALQPDVLCLQEVSRGARESAALLNGILPLAGGGGWQGHGVLDSVIVSRFALRHRDQEVVTDGMRQRGHAIALVDLPPVFSGDLYVLCAHLESGAGADRVRLRELQAGAMTRHIQRAGAGSGALALPPQTTYVVLGDLNVIDEPAPYVDVLRIAGLTDVLPRQNGVGPDFYTWRNDAQPYPPNALDRILFGGSTVVVANAFVLNTTTMSRDALKRTGMTLVDVLRFADRGIHDHLPV